jgi:hypothetical protein
MENLLDLHSKEITLIALVVVLLGTLLVLTPQLLRSHLRKLEMQHAEHLKALEQGDHLPNVDDRARLAGRLSLLVPMVVMITAGSVTGFLAIYNSEQIFPVSLAVWVVAGVVSLAAITGGVALVSRLAHLDDEMVEEQEDGYTENPFPR